MWFFRRPTVTSKSSRCNMSTLKGRYGVIKLSTTTWKLNTLQPHLITLMTHEQSSEKIVRGHNRRNGHHATPRTEDSVNYKTIVSRWQNMPGHVLGRSVCCHGDVTEMHVFYILTAFRFLFQILYANLALVNMLIMIIQNNANSVYFH